MTSVSAEEGRQGDLRRRLVSLYRRRAQAGEPTGPIASRLGEELLKQGDPARAIPLLSEAIEQLDPDGWEDERKELAAAYVNRSLAVMSRTGVPSATDLHRSLELDPRMPHVYGMLGQQEMARGRPDSAAEHFRRALELQPKFVEARFDLVRALIAGGHIVDAERELEKIKTETPQLEKALQQLRLAIESVKAEVQAAKKTTCELAPT
jgi:Tfp pilus assembly protein PilF